MSKKTPWPVLLLGVTMGLVFLACMGFMAITEMGAAKQNAMRWGFIDHDGNEVIEPRFERARAFHNGRAAVRDSGLWGWIGPDGSWIVTPQFSQLCDHRPLSCARDAETGKWGFVDPKGAWAIPAQFDSARNMDDGVAAIGESVGRSSATSQSILHFGLIDSEGAVIVPVKPQGDSEAWTSTRSGSEGLLAVQRGKAWGYVDRTGAWAIEPYFGGAKPFLNGFAAVSASGWAVIDREGRIVTGPGHGLADGASEGLLAGPDGYTTLEGEPVGERYEWVRPHRGGLGAVYRDRQWGFVDTEGNQVIAPSLPRVSDFDGTAALAARTEGLNYVWGIIGSDGSWRVEPRWAKVDEDGFFEGLAAFAR